jgi:hypothetical protein
MFFDGQMFYLILAKWKYNILIYLTGKFSIFVLPFLLFVCCVLLLFHGGKKPAIHTLLNI